MKRIRVYKKKRISKKFKRVLRIYIGIIAAVVITVMGILCFSSSGNVKSKNIEKVKGFTLDSECISKGIIKVDKIKVYRTASGSVEEMNIEDYVKGVVSAEMPANFDVEALKAQAVAARTFAVNKIIRHCPKAQNSDICDSTHCQVYMDKNKRISSWGKNADSLYKKVCTAVDETEGQVITYEGEIITHPQYFAISSGKTEDSVDVFNQDIPYLKSVSSTGEDIAPKYKSNKSIPYSQFVRIVKNSYGDTGINSSNLSSKVKVLSNTKSGAVKEIQIGSKKISGIKFRSLFDLNSSCFKLSFSNGKVTIACTGYGHNTGMSQWGANVMAKSGKKYDEILEHYYEGTKIQKIK